MRYIYVHLMQELSGDATIEAKAACDKVFANFGHKIRHYRTDNGRFAEQKFIDDIKRCNQRISFCGVGAHHQNTIAEQGIKKTYLYCTHHSPTRFEALARICQNHSMAARSQIRLRTYECSLSELQTPISGQH